MDMKKFTELLSIHGADFERWEGVDASDAEALVEENEAARIMLHEAEELDETLAAYDVEGPSPELMKNVMRQVKETPQETNVGRFPSKVFLPAAGLAAVAATVLLMVMSAADISGTIMPQETVAVASVDSLLNEYGALAEEEIEAQEILGLFEMAENSVSTEDDIDVFLDTILEEEEETDVWKMFMEGGTAEL